MPIWKIWHFAPPCQLLENKSPAHCHYPGPPPPSPPPSYSGAHLPPWRKMFGRKKNNIHTSIRSKIKRLWIRSLPVWLLCLFTSFTFIKFVFFSLFYLVWFDLISLTFKPYRRKKKQKKQKKKRQDRSNMKSNCGGVYVFSNNKNQYACTPWSNLSKINVHTIFP